MTFYLIFADYRGATLQTRPFRTYAAARARLMTHFEHAVNWENAWTWYIRRDDGVIIAMSYDCRAASSRALRDIEAIAGGET